MKVKKNPRTLHNGIKIVQVLPTKIRHLLKVIGTYGIKPPIFFTKKAKNLQTAHGDIKSADLAITVYNLFAKIKTRHVNPYGRPRVSFI